ncbi:MAG: hypothetical protein JWQ34_282 [Mucilaginibacter sp.]|nr:hypothetical protein [Mucilaginibacter sp.]
MEGSIKRYLDELDTYGLIKRDTYNTQQGWRRNIHIQFHFFKERLTGFFYYASDKYRTVICIGVLINVNQTIYKIDQP